MSIYYDYETIELRQSDGGIARPISIGWQSGNQKTKQYYINPNAYGTDLNTLTDHNISGGWSNEYKDAFKSHGINSKQLTGDLQLPNGTKLITNEKELTEMYDELLGVTSIKKTTDKNHKIGLTRNNKRTGNIKNNIGSATDEIVGFNSSSFDDYILDDQIKRFGSAGAKRKLSRLKKNDIRKEAFSVLTANGTDFKNFKSVLVETTGYKSTNEDIASLLGIKVDTKKLHDAEYDVSISKQIRESIQDLKGMQSTLTNARSNEEFNSAWNAIKSKYGSTVLQTPKIQSLLKEAGAKGIDVTSQTEEVKKRIEKLGDLNNTEYNSKVSNFFETAKATVSKLSSDLDSKGFSKKHQRYAALATGVIATGMIAKSIFGSNQEEQNKKLETLNDRINASSGEYLEY